MRGRVLAIETSSRRASIAAAVDGTFVASETLPAESRLTSELNPAIARLFARAGWPADWLDAVYFSCGPGSFTGLRVAATVARMLQWAVGCRVVAVPTLEVIVQNLAAEPHPTPEASPEAPRAVVILDAKRGQVFGAAFERPMNAAAPSSGAHFGRGAGTDADAGADAGCATGNDAGTGTESDWRTTIEPGLFDPRALFARAAPPFIVIGEGIAYHSEACRASAANIADEALWWPRAASVLAVGDRLAAAGRFCEPADVAPLYIRRPEAEEVYEQRRSEARQRRGE